MKKNLVSIIGAGIAGLVIAGSAGYLGSRNSYQEPTQPSQSEQFSLEKELNKAYDDFNSGLTKEIEALKKAVPEAFDPKYDPNSYTPKIIEQLKLQGRYDASRDEELKRKLKDNEFNILIFDTLNDSAKAKKKYDFGNNTRTYIKNVIENIDDSNLPKYQKMVPWKIKIVDGKISDEDKLIISFLEASFSNRD